MSTRISRIDLARRIAADIPEGAAATWTCVLGAFQVSKTGDLANWSTGEPDAIPAVGGAMDLAIGAKSVYVMTDLLTKQGTPKLVAACTYPLTGVGCVTRIYTDHAVFDVTPGGLRVRETFGDNTVDSLAARAWADGVFDREIVQVEGHHLARDESIRDGSTVEVLAGLRPVFAAGGTVTAGNSSPVNDGASAVLVAREGVLDGEPLARIAGRAAHGLARRGSGIAVVAICIGVGQGLAVVLER